MAVTHSAASWPRAYARRLVFTDVVAIMIAVGGSQLIWFGLENQNLAAGWQLPISYTIVSVVFAGSWMIALQYFATRDRNILGIGPGEYRRIADATLRIFGLLAIAAFLLQVNPARGYFLTALPVGLFLLLLGRWGWRQWLVRARVRGHYGSSAILVGSRSKSEYVANLVGRYPASGIFVVGAVVPGGKLGDTVGEAPVLGSLDEIVAALDRSGAEMIVLTGSDELPHRAVKRLGWEIEKRGVQLVVVPSLTDIAGPRIHTSPVAGLPLIHVSFPTFEGSKFATKRLADIVLSGLGIVLLSPLLVVVAILVKTTSPGPVLFRHTRIGLRGSEFSMLKFRSMRVGSHEELSDLLEAQGTSTTPLFKVKNDPRITTVGRFIRKYSIDELPQLFNVFAGPMSLVGPRPQVAAEVAQYDDSAMRRLLVKPGLTGLWQISGRSDLSWEDSLRLDLYYVENWSLTGDAIIIVRTIRAVIAGRGAY